MGVSSLLAFLGAGVATLALGIGIVANVGLAVGIVFAVAMTFALPVVFAKSVFPVAQKRRELKARRLFLGAKTESKLLLPADEDSND